MKVICPWKGFWDLEGHPLQTEGLAPTDKGPMDVVCQWPPDGSLVTPQRPQNGLSMATGQQGYDLSHYYTPSHGKGQLAKVVTNYRKSKHPTSKLLTITKVHSRSP